MMESSKRPWVKFYPEYLQVVTDDLASYSDECVSVVKTAVNQLEELLINPGDVNITSLFNLCESIDGYVNSTSDMANFFELIADNFAGIAQYNKNAGRTTSIDDLCDILTNETIGSEGSFDPWYPMGLVETTNEASPVIFIDGTAHCANMYASTDDDLPALTEAREEVNRLIGVWLGVSSAHSQNQH
ncbi:hypothetical protein NQ317_009256 [Molorchus minor]|uniref:Uncharacterized protein n=1 Tax=Molorchus minor TaxID=1323400 RepID=A0ABQ9JCQ4_9CUCU|nr:hypothetical protein NQ317_009256 [Molorchus minor]